MEDLIEMMPVTSGHEMVYRGERIGMLLWCPLKRHWIATIHRTQEERKFHENMDFVAEEWMVMQGIYGVQ